MGRADVEALGLSGVVSEGVVAEGVVAEGEAGAVTVEVSVVVAGTVGVAVSVVVLVLP